MAHDHHTYNGLRVSVDGPVASVTIDHPPMNLLDSVLLDDLSRLAAQLESDENVRVAVFDSADPAYFIAHYDVQALLDRPATTRRAGTLKPFHRLMETYRTLPTVTIARIRGRARGGGSEFALNLDMRFGVIGETILGQFETGVGLIPGGSGTQRLAQLVGRSRALEIILSGGDMDARLAERYGWINRALTAAEIGPFVDTLARRIAAFPSHAVKLAKQAVDAAGPPGHEGLLEEAYLFGQALAGTETRKRLRDFLNAGGQTPEGELDMDWLLERL
ncbi:enoyl-CoA hydratase/isomerase family protein [Streptomyces odontomachi]|uniref:enoyl-CoA hydratase/isomerase family protein n=1 Tax=Streptomyces odontomachi TaxID=2944940 RepID=UPI00210E9AF5|nr:enoyl-CoA hydratase/isomerase family protein [Streptomyces sp. ODS25]